MKIALSQLNVTPGALLTNQAKITDYMHKAAGEGADGGSCCLCSPPCLFQPA